MTNYQLQIKSFVFGPFQTNCYVVTINDQSPMTNDQSPMVLLVDPACAYESEQQQLVRYIENLSPFTFPLSPPMAISTISGALPGRAQNGTHPF